jgi:hypothetical protein
MTKAILYLALFFAAVSCRQNSYGPWQNNTKWELPFHIHKTVVRGRPRQVSEWTYPAGDSVKPAAQRRKHFTRYSFDTSGMATLSESYFGDSLQVEYRQWQDKDGMQEKMTDGIPGHVSLIVSRRLADGRYKITGTGAFLVGAVKVITGFISDSDEVTQEYYTDTATGARPIQMERAYYQGPRLMSIMRKSADTGAWVEIRYFYSSWDVPDSVLTFQIRKEENRLDKREIFFRNSHGDIVRQVTTKGRDSSDRADYSYLYDSKGNWIRQVSNPVHDSRRDRYSREPSIVEREFVY